MHSTISLIVLAFIFVSCDNPNKELVKKETFKEFDYTFYSSFGSSVYSVKLTNSDTVYVKEILFSDSDTTYVGVLNKRTRLKLDTIISKLDITTLDSMYETGHNDGDKWYLYFEQDSIKKSTSIHSLKIPKELNDLLEFLTSIKPSVVLSPTPKNINFVTYEKFVKK